jgi:hypothetical protein
MHQLPKVKAWAVDFWIIPLVAVISHDFQIVSARQPDAEKQSLDLDLFEIMIQPPA